MKRLTERFLMLCFLGFIAIANSGCPLLMLTPLAMTGGEVASITGGGVEIEDFENSVLPNEKSAAQLKIMKRIAITQYGVGNPADSATPSGYSNANLGITKGIAQWIKKNTALQVVTPSEFSKKANFGNFSEMTEEEKLKKLISVGKKLHVDAIVSSENTAGKFDVNAWGQFVGQKSRQWYKFTISLISIKEDKIVWSDVLPYSVTIGTTNVASEEEINKAVMEKVIGRFKEVILGQKDQPLESGEEVKK